MIIKPLDKETYAGRKFTARYKTKGFYDIRPSDFGFRIEYIPFGETVERSFDDEIFSEWLDKPVAFGAFENDVLAGYAEGFLEEWNNRFRISNICIFDYAARSKGVGTLLMNAISDAAKASGARMIVLETHSIEKTDSRLSDSICIPTRTPIRSGTRFGLKWEKYRNDSG